MQSRNWATIVLAIIVVGAFALYTVAFTVQFSETAVVMRFGEITRTIADPGLNWKWPWPVEQVKKFDNRLVFHESRLEQALTADEGSMTVMVFMAWRVSEKPQDVARYFKEIGEVDKAERELTGLARNAMGTVVGRHRFEEFVSIDPKVMKFGQIEQEFKDMIAQQAREKYGIEVRTVGIKRLELPEEATKKAFERMRSEREQLAKQYRAEGEERAKGITAQAKLRASNITNRAEAQAIAIRGEGDAQAAAYYNVFAANPQLHNFIKRLEALEKILPKLTTLILDAGTVPPFELIAPDALEKLGLQGATTQPAKE